MTHDQVIEHIKIAFSDVPYPGDHALVHKKGYNEDVDSTEVELVGKRWQELSLSPETMSGFWIGFLTPLAFQYYLPAFLIHALEVGEEGYLVGQFIWNLIPPARSNKTDRFSSRMDLLTPEQRSAIASFFKAFGNEDNLISELPNGLSDYDRITEYWYKE